MIFPAVHSTFLHFQRCFQIHNSSFISYDISITGDICVLKVVPMKITGREVCLFDHWIAASSDTVAVKSIEYNLQCHEHQNRTVSCSTISRLKSLISHNLIDGTKINETVSSLSVMTLSIHITISTTINRWSFCSCHESLVIPLVAFFLEHLKDWNLRSKRCFMVQIGT